MSGVGKSGEEARRIAEAERLRAQERRGGLAPEATVAGRVPGVPTGSLTGSVAEFDETRAREKLGSDGAARDREIAERRSGADGRRRR